MNDDVKALVERAKHEINTFGRCGAKSCDAMITALTAQAEEIERLRAANYRSFTDGMQAAAEICGTLAEHPYDDADAFEAATGCEAAIIRVVKEQRREQEKIQNGHVG